MKKGQISFAEYLVALVVFISFVAYFSFQLLNFLPNYLTQIRSERVRSEGYQMSEILINDPGSPINWDRVPADQINRAGLNDETKNLTNYISAAKILQLKNLCNNGGYSNIKRWLGSDLDFSILITVYNSNTGAPEIFCPPEVSCSCKPPSYSIRAVNSTIKRFATVDSNHFAEIILQVV